VLPGIALAFAAFGFALLPMTAGGIAAGIAIAMLAVALTRATRLKEDSAFTMLYLISLAAGVTIISLRGDSVDLLHLLFGNILAIVQSSLLLIAGIACFTLITVAIFYRGLVIECFDPEFANTGPNHAGQGIGMVFFGLLVINLVA